MTAPSEAPAKPVPVKVSPMVIPCAETRLDRILEPAVVSATKVGANGERVHPSSSAPTAVVGASAKPATVEVVTTFAAAGAVTAAGLSRRLVHPLNCAQMP